MTAPPAGRLGPRPLPLHLASALIAWLGCSAAWPGLKSGSPLWRRDLAPLPVPGLTPDLAKAADQLAGRLAAVPPEAFAAALGRALRGQADAFLRGLDGYRRHPYRRTLAEPPTVWSEGTTRLLDYAPGGGLPVLVVPSLVNRAHILDLAEGQSLLRHLAGAGLRPLLVDWGAPGAAERGFTLTDYVAGRLEAAFDAAADCAGAPLAILGYCMGGLLALALALRQRRRTTALALLATPWDFHAEGAAQARFAGALAPGLEAAWGGLGEVPVDVMQTLFFALDPLLALRKFSAFAGLDPAGAEARRFVALEDWLNDGVALALPVARETLSGWYGANRPARGEWRIAGRAVAPAEWRGPALVVLPARDRIVPPASAAALARALPGAEPLAAPLGHIGLIAGRGAEAAVWRPLAAWLRRHAADGRKAAGGSGG